MAKEILTKLKKSYWAESEKFYFKTPQNELNKIVLIWIK